MKELKYVIRDRETGTEIDDFTTFEDAVKCMNKYIREDIREEEERLKRTLTSEEERDFENFYEVYDREIMIILL